MRLKEIKPGMVIHCKTQEEMEQAIEHYKIDADAKYIWKYKSSHADDCEIRDCLHFDEAGNYSGFCSRKYFEDEGYNITEFSNLILPELTAEEALLAYDQICKENYCCNDCPLYKIVGDECAGRMNGHISEIVDAITKWKTDREKKELEIETEWFWQGRIYEAEDSGNFYQIKDGTGFYDTGCEYRESAEEYMEDALKEYCKTHDGDYVAVVERVCRVKAVE